jgi:spoIIIJ-associated protein
MPEVERSAPSVEEAIDLALADLGVSEQEATVEVVQEARGGFLGVGAQPAVVRVRAPERSIPSEQGVHGGPVSDDAAEPRDSLATIDSDVSAVGGDVTTGPDHRSVAPGTAADADAGQEPSSREEQRDEPDVDDQADVAADFLEDVLDRMGMDAVVEIVDVDGITYVDIWGEDDEDSIGALIGRRGATLDGLQELVRSVIQRQTGERCQVVVDVEDYRKRRRSQLIRMAHQAATKARRTGQAQTLEPMTAYERKLVHDAVADLGDLTTESEGEEPNRRVVIRAGAAQSEG